MIVFTNGVGVIKAMPLHIAATVAAFAQIPKFSDTLTGFLTALATIAIAYFTFTLKRSTDKLWRAGNDALETTERAFVYLDGFNDELAVAADQKDFSRDMLSSQYRDRPELFITRFAVQPRWTYGGNTPTKNMKISVNWGVQEGPSPFKYPFVKPAIPFFVAPKAREVGEFIEILAARLLVEWGLGIVAIEPTILVWGTADYEDIFGGNHQVKWCYRIRLESHKGQRLNASFIQWGDHNSAHTEQRNRYSLISRLFPR